MEVKADFKQIEIGAIPKDWKLSKLGSHATFKTGPFGSALHRSDYVDDGIPVINPMHIVDGRLRPSSSMAVSQQAARKLSDFRLSAGNIVIGRRGDMGRCAVVQPQEHGWLCGTGSMIVQIASSVDGRFIQRVLSSPPIVAAIVNASVGSTMVNLNQGTLANLLVPLPPTKAEQEAIANALGDADAHIESLEQLLNKKRNLKQGIMQELLAGKTRLPGFSAKWEEQSLFELAGGKKELFDDGDWIEAEHITSEGVRLVQTGNIGIGTFIERDDKKYVFENSFFSLRCKEIRQGDLLICRLAEPAGRSCVLPNIREAKIITSVDVTIFRPPATVANRVFLANVFSTDQWFRAVNDRSGGTTHKRIARGALGRLRIRIPTVDEQTAIATVLADMDAAIVSLEEKLSKARQLKQGLAQQLLTGRMRLV